jgi:multicomponent Na+:H+ antiporter subunit B
VSSRARVVIALVAGAVLLALLVWGTSGLPPFGHYPGPYGDEVVHHAVVDRHATNAVTSIVMDIRAVDTVGEELILFASVVGVIMLFRPRPEERSVPAPGLEQAYEHVEPSRPVRVVSSLLVAPVTLLALYLVVHGQLTPGGGFQGGVVLAAPSLLVLLAAQRRSFDRLHRPSGWEIGQAIAVTAFIGVGFAGLFAGSRAFLANFLPHGVTGTVFSAGTIPVLNLIAGPAVATAIVLLTVELVHQVTGVGSG